MSINGSPAVSFLKENILTDGVGTRTKPHKMLKVMDIIIGLTQNVIEDGEVSTLQVVQAPTGKRALTSERSKLLRGGGIKVHGALEPGAGRAWKRKNVDASDLDSVRPSDLHKHKLGWAVNHRQKKLNASHSADPPWTNEESNAVYQSMSEDEACDHDDVSFNGDEDVDQFIAGNANDADVVSVENELEDGSFAVGTDTSSTSLYDILIATYEPPSIDNSD